MADLESIRAILHSKYIDSSNVKPYTGLHINTGGKEKTRIFVYFLSINFAGWKENVKLIFLFSGDLILSTPSLDSYRVNKDPLYPYDGNMSARLPKQVDYRILSYDSLETHRYRTLRMKQPIPLNVTRIFQERCKTWIFFSRLSRSTGFLIILVGAVVPFRAEPSRTIRVQTAPGYRLLVDQIPNQDQTMISQRFNKISPFYTEHGNNPNSNPVLRHSIA